MPFFLSVARHSVPSFPIYSDHAPSDLPGWLRKKKTILIFSKSLPPTPSNPKCSVTLVPAAAAVVKVTHSFHCLSRLTHEYILAYELSVGNLWAAFFCSRDGRLVSVAADADAKHWDRPAVNYGVDAGGCDGWLSSHFLNRGWTPNAARKTAMLICALAVVPIVFAAQTTNV